MADKKLIDVKKASNETLIKLWVEHYKKYFDDKDDRLLTKNELQELYDEAYDRGLKKKLVLLYNAMFMIHTVVRTDINNSSTLLLSRTSPYSEEYRLIKHLASIFNDFKADTKEVKKYREDVTQFLLKEAGYLPKELFNKKRLKDDEYTVGEIGIENALLTAKKSLLLIRKLQRLIPDIDIVSEKSKKQCKELRQFIEIILSEMSNDITDIKYYLGILEDTGKEEDEEEEKENEEIAKKYREGDFYAFIDKHIGIERFKEDAGRLERLIQKHLKNEEQNKATGKLFDKLFNGFDEGVKDRIASLSEEEKEAFRKELEEAKDRYPIEDVGLSKEDIEEVEWLVEDLSEKEELI